MANGRAAGVVTDKGEKIEARAVVSNLHPKLTFERLVDPALLPADFRARIASWRSASGVFRMNLALAELPSFSCLPGRAAAEHHGAGIIFAPSLAYMERAFMDARRSGWSKAPIVEMLIPSVLDEHSRRPDGTSPRSSASMSRRNSPTGDPGTRRARRWPIS